MRVTCPSWRSRAFEKACAIVFEGVSWGELRCRFREGEPNFRAKGTRGSPRRWRRIPTKRSAKLRRVRRRRSFRVVCLLGGGSARQYDEYGRVIPSRGGIYHDREAAERTLASNGPTTPAVPDDSQPRLGTRVFLRPRGLSRRRGAWEFASGGRRAHSEPSSPRLETSTEDFCWNSPTRRKRDGRAYLREGGTHAQSAL